MTAPWLPPVTRNPIKYRIHQGVLMAFHNGEPLKASKLHRWKVQFVDGLAMEAEIMRAAQIASNYHGAITDATPGE